MLNNTTFNISYANRTIYMDMHIVNSAPTVISKSNSKVFQEIGK